MQLQISSIERKSIKTAHIELEYDEVTIGDRKIRYVTTAFLSNKRIKSLVTKEPLTLPWIDTIKPGEVYVDVGGNVGMYAIYAGVVGAKVYAFEPESQNYAELNKNIFVNELHGQVTAYCMAISDVADISLLYLSTFSIGFAHHDFGENRWAGDRQLGNNLLIRDERPQQGCVSFSLDELVSRKVIDTPNHLKIDVDGFENKVIRGANSLLQSQDLRSVLLEVDFDIPESIALIKDLTDMGWKFSKDQVRLNQHAIVPYEQIEQNMKRGRGGANFIFYRDEDFYGPFFSRYAETFIPPNPKGI
jgi:FkbM family methyltransferase